MSQKGCKNSVDSAATVAPSSKSSQSSVLRMNKWSSYFTVTILLASALQMHIAGAEDVLSAVTAGGLPSTCAQIVGNTGVGENVDEKLLLCQLYESSTLLAQLGALVSEGLDRLMLTQGVLAANAANAGSGEMREKRKHEYLRFGKRKHEYLRFGKRKHEYLRFG